MHANVYIHRDNSLYIELNSYGILYYTFSNFDRALRKLANDGSWNSPKSTERPIQIRIRFP